MKTINLIIISVCLALATATHGFNTHGVTKDESAIDPRIVGGENAQEGQFPYQASIHNRIARDFFCSGSILSNRFVLTAAHCMRNRTPANIFAIVGTLNRLKGGVAVEFNKITVHPGWNSRLLINDIALLRTANEIVFSDTIQPIALPKENLPNEENTQVILSGWGKTSVSVLIRYFVYFGKSCN